MGPAIFEARPTQGWLATKDDVKAAMGEEKTLIVDCLTPELFEGRGDRHHWGQRRGHIPGAVNVPYLANVDPALVTATAAEREQLLAGNRSFNIASRQHLRRLYSAAGVSADNTVITYCGRGYAAACGMLALKVLGHRDVRLHDGSWSEWSADPALPTEMS